MSAYIERMILEKKTQKKDLVVLQEIYENRGGVGDVKDFLAKGATDPDDGEPEHWGTMTDEERKLWLALDETSLTAGYISIKVKTLGRNDIFNT